MNDYVVKKEFGARPGRLVRFLGAGKTELEWCERSYAKTFTLAEAHRLAVEHGGEVVRA